MPGTTPTQGFPYPVASDPPCNWPATMLSLATALDTKFQSFDADAARLTRRVSVKISRTGSPTFSYDSNAGNMLFDTLEFNYGTPTDLTVDPNRLQLNPGFYLLYGKVIIPTVSGVAGGNFHVQFSGNSAQISPGQRPARDYGSGFTPTTVTWVDQMYVPSGTGKVSISLITPASNLANINYASIAAWWFADA